MSDTSSAPGRTTGSATRRFDRSNSYFDGHFEGNPILPGVVLIDLAVGIVAADLNRPLRLQAVGAVKFCSVVMPGQDICFTYTASDVEGAARGVKVKGTWMRGAEKIAEMAFSAVEPAGRKDGP